MSKKKPASQIVKEREKTVAEELESAFDVIRRMAKPRNTFNPDYSIASSLLSLEQDCHKYKTALEEIISLQSKYRFGNDYDRAVIIAKDALKD